MIAGSAHAAHGIKVAIPGEGYVHLSSLKPTWLMVAVVDGTIKQVANRMKYDDLEARNCQGTTALHFAAGRGKYDALVLLLSGLVNGVAADHEAVDDDGMTALMYAAAGGYVGVVEFLLSIDADPRKVSNSGRTARHYAEVNGNPEVAALFPAHGA